MSKAVFRREEFFGATLRLGSIRIDLADYATTGLRIVTLGPSGVGKTNNGLVIAEQLSEQGWVSVLVSPEEEIEALYGAPVDSPDELRTLLTARERKIIVVAATNTESFLDYGKVVQQVADRERKPIFLMIDEGQLFSASRKRSTTREEAKRLADATELVNDLAMRGRKRCLDLFMTAGRFANSLHRSVFATKNLTLIGSQEDPAAWSSIAPLFKGTGLGFSELQALAPGEFICCSRRGTEKVVVQMAKAMAAVAPKARTAQRTLPSTYSQWDRAMRSITTERLEALSPELVGLFGSIVGLTPQQLRAGQLALQDELSCR